MTDREMLTFAATAVGMRLTDNGVRDLGSWEWLRNSDTEWGLYCNNANGTQRRWNPLTEDGDALRLAVKLGLTVEVLSLRMEPFTRVVGCGVSEEEEHRFNPNAATRRAIVRAAAAIGKELPND